MKAVESKNTFAQLRQFGLRRMSNRQTARRREKISEKAQPILPLEKQLRSINCKSGCCNQRCRPTVCSFYMTLFAPPAKSREPGDKQRRLSSGLAFTALPALRGRKISITVLPLPGEEVGAIFNRLAAFLKEREATMLHLLIFGSLSARATAMAAMRRIFGAVDWPVTWADGAACDGSPIAGLQVSAFAGGDAQRVQVEGRVVGSVVEDGAFRYCFLGGLWPSQPFASRADQAKQTFDHLEEALAAGGFALADVVRTWFFLDAMLDWYDEFNQVRTQVYTGVRFRSGSLPASTGIGARNPAAAALVASAWAVQPLRTDARILEVASPLQCPASAYGSSFSRAMELSSPTGRRLFISGTASISPEGRTLWPEDARRQVAQTMQVVEAVLRSRGLSWSDMTRATGYFKHRTDAQILGEWCAVRGLVSMSAVLAHCDVCREDLLFELELDAWRSNQVSQEGVPD